MVSVSFENTLVVSVAVLSLSLTHFFVEKLFCLLAHISCHASSLFIYFAVTVFG